MKISPELADIVRDKLVYYQIITVPYGQGEFQRRALSLIRAIDEQRAKEAAEGRERAA